MRGKIWRRCVLRVLGMGSENDEEVCGGDVWL